MSAYRKILLLLDGSMVETKGLKRAKHLAWMEGAELHLCLIDHSKSIQALGTVSHELMELARRAFIAERQQWLQRIAASIEESGVRVHTETLWGHPAHTLALARIAELQPDLVITDLPQSLSRTHAQLGAIDRHLLHQCAQPLLLIRGNAQDPPCHILVAVDLADVDAGTPPFNAQLVAAARNLADNCKAAVDLVSVCEDLPILTLLPSFELTERYEHIHQAQRAAHAQTFRDFALQQGLAETAHFLTGLPLPGIVDCARRTQADIVVIGSLHHTVLDRYVLGSTADGVVGELSCDVLIVKPQRVLQPDTAAAPRRLQERTTVLS